MEFLTPSWDDIHLYSAKLALKVLEDYRPDIIIGVLRGGYIVARIVADIMGVKDLGVVEVKFYKGVGETAEKPVITQPLVADVKDKNVLIVDDVVDSGRTLQIVTEQTRLRGAKNLKSASIYYKPRSIARPDYFIVETSKWILFPWEAAEFLEDMGVYMDLEKATQLIRDSGIKVREDVARTLLEALKTRASKTQD
ncbi:MAG: phosphoribosyltransferase [Desulfurococcales archaeon]|nr:phosphoribosyltransferase [Desulfurococcales archaeon]